MFTTTINNKSINLLTLQDYLKLTDGDFDDYLDVIQRYLGFGPDTPKSIAEYQLLLLIMSSISSEDIYYMESPINRDLIQLKDSNPYILDCNHIKILFKEPTIGMNNDNPIDILISCIDKVYQDDESVLLEDLSAEEFTTILQNITIDKFDDIIDNISNNVVLYHKVGEEFNVISGFNDIVEILR